MKDFEKSNHILLQVADWITVPQELVDSRRLRQHYIHYISVGRTATVDYFEKDKQDHWGGMYKVNFYDTGESELYIFGDWLYSTSRYYDAERNDVTV